MNELILTILKVALTVAAIAIGVVLIIGAIGFIGTLIYNRVYGEKRSKWE